MPRFIRIQDENHVTRVINTRYILAATVTDYGQTHVAGRPEDRFPGGPGRAVIELATPDMPTAVLRHIISEFDLPERTADLLRRDDLVRDAVEAFLARLTDQ